MPCIKDSEFWSVDGNNIVSMLISNFDHGTIAMQEEVFVYSKYTL